MVQTASMRLLLQIPPCDTGPVGFLPTPGDLELMREPHTTLMEYFVSSLHLSMMAKSIKTKVARTGAGGGNQRDVAAKCNLMILG